MVAHRRSILALLALPLALVAACDKVPLLAPTGSVITLFPVTTTVSLNSEVTIVATVIENGSAPAGTGTGSGTTTTTNTGAGTPVQNGTLITFTTTIGRIEPSEARTHNGQVTVKLITGGTSGSATITAYSGGASAQIKDLKIGTAAAKTVTVTTTPQALGASGGSVQVIASVIDDGGNPLSGIPVSFATDKGTISPSTATTDSSGNATATLTTTTTAKIIATAGTVASKETTVTVNARSLTSFNSDGSGTTQVGSLVTFTVTPAAGANITNVHVEFGDGASIDLGPIGSATPTSTRHAYQSTGIFTATASARDASGDVQQLTTTVSVGSLQLTLSAAPSPADKGQPVIITVNNVAAQVREFQWFFDDGTPSYSTTAPQTTKVFSSAGAKTIRVDVIGLSGAKIGTAQITMIVK
jgi:hypothetical protein